MALQAPGTSKQRGALLLIAASILFRVYFYAQGGSFIARPLNFALQYLDPVLLRNDLLNSLLYLHSQPPLFNLMLGVVLKISPEPALSYWMVFTTAGLLIPLLLYNTLLSVGLGVGAALAVTLLFMFNPTLILYENLLYYTHIETFFVMLSLCSLARWYSEKRATVLVMFWSALLCLGLIRSLYHPVFFAVLVPAFAGYVWLRCQSPRTAVRLLVSGMLIVIVPLAVLCTKNYVLYGFFGTSSWDGISLWNKVNGYDETELESLHQRGVVSRRAVEAGFEPFKAIDRYPGLAQKARCHHPADCTLWKSTGKPNFNHSGYVLLSRELRADAISLIKHDPRRFVLYTAGAYSLTLWYSSDSVHALFQNNMEIVAPIEKIYRFIWFGFLGIHNRYSDPRVWLYAGCVTALYLMLYGAGLRMALACTPDRNGTAGLISLFCCVLHSYTLIVSSLIEFGENNRFRYPVDGTLLVLAVSTATLWWNARRFRQRKLLSEEPS